MKGFKTILGALAAASLLFSVNAFAQENNNRDENGNVEKGPYLTNELMDNTFVSLGFGVNSVIDGLFSGAMPFKSAGLGVDLNVGKWFTPTIGLRAGWTGINNVGNLDGRGSGAYHNLHLDVLFNASNFIDGYKETRFWNFIPYFEMGLTQVGGWHDLGNATSFRNFVSRAMGNIAYGAGFGLLNDIYLNERWNLNLDAHFLIGQGKEYQNAGGRFVGFGTLTFGGTYKFGKKTGFSRYSSIAPVVIPVPFTTDQYNALKDKVDALEKENAELKDKVAALEAENAKIKDLLKEGNTYVYKDGEFVEAVANIASPATLYFDCGQAKLSERELAHLEFYAENALNEDTQLLLVGSADKQTGSARRNQQLSEMRANYVKNLLVKKYGVKEENIETLAEGARNNVYNTPAKNRCVTIKIK